MRNPNRGVTWSIEFLSLDLRVEVVTGEKVLGRYWFMGIIEALGCVGSPRSIEREQGAQD